MSEFIRENRYIVIKRGDLDKLYKDPTKYATTFGHALALIAPHLPKRKFVVVESDWPEYEPVWQMIERRISGLPDELSALREDADQFRESSLQLASRLLAAEQRNADQLKLIIGLVQYADGLLSDVNNAWSYAGSTGAPEIHKDSDYIAAVELIATLKPTESGASE